jgi:hypothetical protein
MLMRGTSTELFKRVECPVCRSQLLRVSEETAGTLEIPCHRCARNSRKKIVLRVINLATAKRADDRTGEISSGQVDSI